MVADMDVDISDEAIGTSHMGSTSAPSLALHRVRFVDWSPSGITALAFAPSNPSSPTTSSRGILAIGRENGNIDLCLWIETQSDPSGSSTSRPLAKGWIVDTTLIGPVPSKMESLAFVLCPTTPNPTLRLFSTSGGPTLVEHFLPPHLLSTSSSSRFETSTSLVNASRANTMAGTTRSLPSNGGSIWSLAASPLGKRLAIGCHDGHVRLIDIEDGRFEHVLLSRRGAALAGQEGGGGVSTLDRAKSRVVSLAWGPPKRRKIARKKDRKPLKTSSDSDTDEEDDDDDDMWQDTFLVGGTTESAVVVWELQTGRIEGKLTVNRNRHEQTIVWSCLTLGDGTIVVGDSMGMVSFFDARTRTPIPDARFSTHSKDADVLSLCAGPDGRSVYSGSVDQRVAEYALLGDGPSARWAVSGIRRLHAHDVRAVAVDPPFDPRLAEQWQKTSPRLPIVVSGGVDYLLVMTPASSPSQTLTLADFSGGKGERRSKWKGRGINKRAERSVDVYNPISNNSITAFADTTQRRIPYTPASGKGGALGAGQVITMCESKRWLILRREKSIAIWRLNAPSSTIGAVADEATEEGEADHNWAKLLEMELKVKTNLVSVATSMDGRFLAVSDLYETKLFSLLIFGDDISPKRIKSFTSVFGSSGAPGASAMTFSPDGNRLILATHPGSFIHLVQLPPSDESSSGAKCKVIASFDQHRIRDAGRAVVGKRRISQPQNLNGHDKHNGKLSSDDTSDAEDDKPEDAGTQRTMFARIDILQVSPDGQYLVSIDSARRIHTYSLDLVRHQRALPSPAHVPSSCCFDPARPSRLLLTLPSNQLQVLDIENRGSDVAVLSTDVTDDSDQLSFVNRIEGFIADVRESAVGSVWIPPLNSNGREIRGETILVWGPTWICTMRKQRSPQQNGLAKNKRKGEMSSEATEHSERSWVAKLTFKYQPLLFVGALDTAFGSPGDKEIVLVERPSFALAQNQPPPYYRGISYGK